ncbi:50S ribosomal protein L30 [Candidatus Sordicultor fermentans]|uniref:50S ribosomal protein L30 n=1 Tax=Candidatus Sordicultor fermentans TaxID=1953203 RepID=UPI0016A0B8A2|nr:50S ribosomal protein L30 [Candidatus Atribacteria bacterium]
MGEKSLKITLKKSPIGRPESHKRTVKALGLHKLNQTVYHKDSSSLRGMVNKISYLLEVEEVESAEEGER